MASTLDTGSAAEIPPRWSRVLRLPSARALLGVTAGLVLWAVLPIVVGWQPHLIMTGSMSPRIEPGDIVVTKPVDPATLKLGRVITVDDPDHPGRTRTHRLVRIDDHGDLVLRGDANQTDDSTPVTLDSVHGLGVIRVPYVGRPLLWLQSQQYLKLGGLLIALMWATATVIAGRGTRRDECQDDDRDQNDHGPGLPGQRVTVDESTESGLVGQHRRRVTVGVASAVVAGLFVGSAPADAAFKKSAANPTSAFTAAASFGGYKDTVLGDSPFFYWRLNEASGFSVNDSTSNNRDGSIQNSTTFGVAGAITSEASDKAIRLSNERITGNDKVTAPSTFTIETWIKTTSSTGGRIMGFGNKNGSTDSTLIDRNVYLGNDGKVYFGLASGKKVISSGTAVNNGAWHHVVATYTSGANGMKLYVDGALKAQSNGTLTNIPCGGYWRAGGEVMSGWTANPNDNFYDGTLDEVAVYTKVLTAAEISEHYAEAS